ncbi:unnamed protein product, partial [Linum tenue]
SQSLTTRASGGAIDYLPDDSSIPTIPPSRRRRSIRASRRRRAPLRGDSSSADADDSSIPTPDLFLRSEQFVEEDDSSIPTIAPTIPLLGKRRYYLQNEIKKLAGKTSSSI